MRTASIDDFPRPKVGDLDSVVIVEEQVLGFQIAGNEALLSMTYDSSRALSHSPMNHTFGVHIIEGIDYLSSIISRTRNRQRP